MKENVLDVLMYLFDHYLEMAPGEVANEDTLTGELEEAGFATGEINKAFTWLGELADLQECPELEAHAQAFRVLTEFERNRLDLQCQGFLLDLEQKALLTPMLREIVLDRAMAIDSDPLTLEHFRRVVGLVLMNASPSEAMIAWAEGLIYEDIGGLIH